MTTNAIDPLRIENEAFMVAATIERCPKSMMLRELVMNALEAAASAPQGERRVVVDRVMVGGVAKLRIVNTGRGLSADELFKVSDLSSSLFKTVGLDGNFGMGGKAASLASNRHGMRYRSCREGVVSEVTLGERGGVYGRLRTPRPDGTLGEVQTVTALVREDGEHPLTHDWTEVVLLGNAPDQDTAADPYGGDPVVGPNWVNQALARRFVRLAPDIALTVALDAQPQRFTPAFRADQYDHIETVTVADGIKITYAYRSETSQRPTPPIPMVGLGTIVYDDEVYALFDGRRWLLEAPTYGFTFAARRCTVQVELPADSNVQPEQYRQFLRFRSGEQKQVVLADYGELIRTNIPPWMKRIIDAMRPGSADYLSDINADLSALLEQLGIEDTLWRKPAPKSTDDTDEERRPPDPDAPPPVKTPPREEPVRGFNPPEIVVIREDEQLAEKALGGRAARYFPQQRQLFVNARYEAFVRLAAELAEEFSASADPQSLKALSQEAAEWALIRRLARTLIHTLGKGEGGWSEEEVKGVQSPEPLTLLVDDFEAQLVPARQRLLALLGLDEAPEAAPASWRFSIAQRDAAMLAEAEAALQTALANKAANVASYYRRIANLRLRQKDLDGARAALDKGIAADPNDPACQAQLCEIFLATGKIDEAAVAADTAVRLAKEGASALAPFRRKQASIEVRRNNEAGAKAILEEAISETPEDGWLHFDLAGRHLVAGAFDAAAQSLAEAERLAGADTLVFVRRRAAIALGQGDRVSAEAALRRLASQNPLDTAARLDLVNVLAGDPDNAAAMTVIAEGLEADILGRPQLLRMRSRLEEMDGNIAAAIASAAAACEAAPDIAGFHMQHAALLRRVGDLEAADAAYVTALAVTPQPDARIVSARATLAGQRNLPEEADVLARQAIALDPTQTGAWMELSRQRLKQGDADGAAEAIDTAIANGGEGRGRLLRRRSEIAFHIGDVEGARRFINAAIASDAADPATLLESSKQHMAAGNYDTAHHEAHHALTLPGAPAMAIYCRLAQIDVRRAAPEEARAWLGRAMEADPSSPQPWLDLARLLSDAGDLKGAEDATHKALALESARAA